MKILPLSRLAEFFAQLIESPNLEELSAGDLERLLVPLEPSLVKARETWPFRPDEVHPDPEGISRGDRALMLMEPLGHPWSEYVREERLLVLSEIQREAREKIRGMLNGERVPLNVSLHLSLKGRVPVESERETIFLLQDGLTQVLRRSPFPFARCRKCRKVFVTSRLGKPRIYCSKACKAKGVPSATKRALYAKNYRCRIREAELNSAIEVLRHSARDSADAALAKRFPDKTPRERLYLRRDAERRLRSRRANRRPPDLPPRPDATAPPASSGSVRARRPRWRPSTPRSSRC